MNLPGTNSEAVALSGQAPVRSAVYLQDDCYQHRFIRSRDTSSIVERPERLRAVKLGLAAAIAHLEDSSSSQQSTSRLFGVTDTHADDLANALNRMNLTTNPLTSCQLPFSFVQSSATIDILNHAAVKFVHGDIDGDVYLEKLKMWAKTSHDKIANGESEIPEGLSQSDLYLCPGSLSAIQGAIGTVCEAVDAVFQPIQPETSVIADASCRRAFVAIRPPGHHCGEDTPSGFCFVNNVAIGAAHAHLKHGVNRVVILDIDLHHGNGTQSIVWQINEETYRKTLESEHSNPNDRPPSETGLQVYYGSIHDILSYPCEDGKMELVQAASVSLHGRHGQHIENIHLESYTSHTHFWDVHYKKTYSGLLGKAKDFLDQTGGVGDDVLVFISCGFDACEHEHTSMSRHGRRVPASFYHRFTKDACAFADQYARGRLVSVLEGGYSDHALISGAMAHACGLMDLRELGGQVDEDWWSLRNILKLEAATKKRKGGRQSLNGPKVLEPWLDRATAIFSSLENTSASLGSSSQDAILAGKSMTLRERKKPSQSVTASTEPSPAPSPGKKGKNKGRKNQAPGELQKNQGWVEDDDVFVVVDDDTPKKANPSSPQKKLPRVILRVGPPPFAPAS